MCCRAQEARRPAPVSRPMPIHTLAFPQSPKCPLLLPAPRSPAAPALLAGAWRTEPSQVPGRVRAHAAGLSQFNATPRLAKMPPPSLGLEGVQPCFSDPQGAGNAGPGFGFTGNISAAASHANPIRTCSKYEYEHCICGSGAAPWHHYQRFVPHTSCS